MLWEERETYMVYIDNVKPAQKRRAECVNEEEQHYFITSELTMKDSMFAMRCFSTRWASKSGPSGTEPKVERMVCDKLKKSQLREAVDLELNLYPQSLCHPEKMLHYS
ncbi:hypothetical protein PR048_006247 [Dryococelus australis]|uniref:Uncharacterized protein n=1 Tax=Dryococelus australis TaxID=614101 RepID=A0ABQ9IB12_9NEOP|nr:hypothetical protein PR048_006247 [Dryococelus australis]